jgi:DNA-binding transcriptional MerR regulator
VRIGEAARIGGVSPRSLRHYEDEGLIVPGRCSNGYRDYCRSTLDRVILIRSLLESGLPVRLIREVLPHLAAGAPGRDRLPDEFLAEVRRHRDRLDARILALTARRSALDAFLDGAAPRSRGTA